MKRALSVTWFAIRSIYDELFPLAGMGLLWFAMAILLPYGIFWLSSTLIPITAVVVILVLASLILAPPATAALFYVAGEIAHERRIEFSYFWTGFKTYFWTSWKIAGVILVSGAILIVDVFFYLNSDNTVFSVLGFLGLWALAFWLAIQIYLFPLMILQEDKKLKLILKNASLLTLAYPLFALGILIAGLLATALSVLLVFILLATLWMPFISLLSSRATISSLEQVENYRQSQAETQEAEEAEEAEVD